MAQTVIVDGNNVVKIIDAGPPGPPGFGVSPPPTELLPLPISRQVPYTAWTQFGIPLAAFSYAGLRVVSAYPNAPAEAQSIDSSGQTPLYWGNGDDVNFGFAGTLFSSSGGSAEGSDVEVVLTGLIYNGGGGPSPVELGVYPLARGVGTSSTPSQEEFKSFFDTNRGVSTRTFAVNELLLGLTLTVRYVDGGGALEGSDAHLTFGIHEVSAWVGNPSALAAIDADRGESYLGMAYASYSGVNVNGPATPNWGSMLLGDGLRFSYITYNEDETITTGPHGEATVGLDSSDPENEFVYLGTAHLRVATTPVHANDVIRKTDLDAAPGPVQPMSAQFDMTGLTDLTLTTLVLSVDMVDQTIHVPNPGVGKWAAFQIWFNNPDTVNHFLDFDCEATHWTGSSTGPGFAPGVYKYAVLVLGGETVPTIDFVEVT